MLGRLLQLGLIAAMSAAPFFSPAPALADIINLSCDDGGMLLVIDTGHGTVTDSNPFQRTKVVAPLTMTADSFAWREGAGDGAADYRMNRATRMVSAKAHGAAVPLSNPQCGRSAVLIPKS
ncbi:MAG TPA: hypothetical protein VHX99_00475 [Rhizomicrobium sp.]|jgi:hypothetical protein|nr:hypothetical protein [Rhizomicrobium sp.]